LASSIIAAGIGLAYGAIPALVVAAVPLTDTAAAHSLNTLMRSVGAAVSSAVAGAVLAAMTPSIGGASVASQDGFRVRVAGGGVARRRVVPSGEAAAGALR